MPRIAALILLAACALGAADLALIDLKDKGLLGHVAANEPDKAGLSLFSLVQAKAGPAVVPGGRGIGLGEFLEDQLLLVRRDADTGVAHDEAQQRLRRPGTLRRHGDP